MALAMKDHSMKEDNLKRMALSDMKLGQSNWTEPFSAPTLMAVKHIIHHFMIRRVCIAYFLHSKFEDPSESLNMLLALYYNVPLFYSALEKQVLVSYQWTSGGLLAFQFAG